MIVHPEIIVTPDFPRVLIREPRETTDLETVLNRILIGQGWEVGTHFWLQFVSHDRMTLLSDDLYVVDGEMTSLQTNEDNPNQPITKAVTKRSCRLVYPMDVNAIDAQTTELPPGDPVGVEHKGFGNWAVVDELGSTIRMVTAAEGGKETAEAIVRGERAA